MPAPAPLPENLPFAFAGETLDVARTISSADAKRLRAARNVTGKPNADVLRECIGITRDGEERRVTAIDFPTEMTKAEAQLYAAPFALLAGNGAALHSPTRHDDLRNALARLDRFLACPANETEPTFAWIEADVLPDDSLVVWARDDDFSAGVLAARAFALWCKRCAGVRAALRSFPFPWPPATPLGSLTRAQEEQRFALSRAARSDNSDAIESVLASAYGWPADLDEIELLARLNALHAARSNRKRIGVGTAHWIAPLLPPNRTGGSPASGSPVGE